MNYIGEDYNLDITNLIKQVYMLPEMTYRSVPWKGDILTELEDMNSDQGISIDDLLSLKSYEVKDILTELDNQMKQHCHTTTKREEDEWCVVYIKMQDRFIELALEEMKGVVK